ncbi:Peptide transporter PTR5 [Dendrobium catenatum]|uniref:Peptide transporter PTR5 n=1 Tax=Dendrobium catenatum TaxID=906689 RepID=A0A2I0VGN5_9ASPA|nr:Peptide transporter PTR5 [Dendrobium catenatum]
MTIAVVIFFIGMPLYRHQKLGGSPLTRIVQVLMASIRKYDVKFQLIKDDKSL